MGIICRTRLFVLYSCYLFFLPSLSALCKISWAAIEIAISAGVSAFIARPIGVVILASSESVYPKSRSFCITAAVLCLLPITPMYAAGVFSTCACTTKSNA